jgi:hypothetical protein
MRFKTLSIATSTFVCAVLFSFGWSEQGGISLSIGKAEAQTRLHVSPIYAAHAIYYNSTDLPWYAVRAYYFDGPWSGPGYSYAGWDDYAKRNGIGCRPGTLIKGGDGLMYLCQ